ncbi:MAG: hydroxymethylglutaryl-CoA lyase [Coxiellaceae bacterium]|nr:hydroxymethylglutaryl-CoA lyase [Coxiellaceae bacterium]
MALPNQVSIVEVGPRDGLQNEPKSIATDVKLALIDKLADSGLKTIEATSFVSPKWIPQMGDHTQLMQQLDRRPDITYPVLVPNLQGYEAAQKAGANTIAVFTAASETFSKKNTNCTIDEGLQRISDIIERAKSDHIAVRGYISTVLGCPYEGKTSTQRVVNISRMLLDMGCYEVSLGDTIGIGTPGRAKHLIKAVHQKIDLDLIAMHYHDTYGQALANIYASLELGVSKFDSSVAGLGGCPYAPGASGNVATEDVLYMLQGLDIETGVDLNKVVEAGYFISKAIGRPTRSRVAAALKHQADR